MTLSNEYTIGTQQEVPDNGLAAERHTGAYIASGLLLLLYGLVPAAWTAYTLIVRETPFEDFLSAAFWPSMNNHVMAMTPYEWAFSVALIVVGLCALARRRAARGGALLFAVAVLGLSVREVVGLFDEAYLDEYMTSDEGPWLMATRIAGLLVGVVVLVLMGRAGEERDGHSRLRAPVVAGGLMVLAGLVSLIGLLTVPGLDEYLGEVVDPSSYGPNSMFGGVPYYFAFVLVSLLVVGGMALSRRRVARGAGLVLLPVAGYLGLVTLAQSAVFLRFDMLFYSADYAWAAAQSLVPLLAAVIGIPLLAWSSARRESGADDGALDPAAFTPFPSDVGQQDPGRH